MICKHDRLARSCNECALIDDIAELESAHRMMAARNERLQKENDALAKALRKANEYIDKVVTSCQISEYLNYDQIISEGNEVYSEISGVLYGLEGKEDA